MLGGTPKLKLKIYINATKPQIADGKFTENNILKLFKLGSFIFMKLEK